MSFPVRSLFSTALIIGSLCAAHDAHAVTFQTLHAFVNTDGAGPSGALVLDSAGNLYGTTSGGGSGLGGTLFKLKPSTHRLTTLHQFIRGTDGTQPQSGLVLSNGIFYGTTHSSGGTAGSAFGTAFKVNSETGILRTLHAFSFFGNDGGNLNAAMIVRNGILYGTTSGGGARGGGTVFQLDPATRQLHTLHAFSSGLPGLSQGAGPYAGVVFDSTRAIYGTTSDSELGDLAGSGTVFMLAPTTHALTTLHNFTGGLDGGFPRGDLLLRNGVLYGTTSEGGRGFGVVFKLDPATRRLTVLHKFTGIDGSNPVAGVTMRGGSLYGTTSLGGPHGFGTVYKLAVATNQLITLHAFTSGQDGAGPKGTVIFDSSGALYGTTYAGANRYGTVFKLVP